MTDQLAILRLLVARYDETDPHVGLAWVKLTWLEHDTGLEHDEVIARADELIDAGLVETSGTLLRAVMPQAREALVFKGTRSRLSSLAT
jgi:hypothetical protein